MAVNKPAEQPGYREVRLPDGRVLTIRPVTGADEPGLQALYDGLSFDDLHRRFFSVYHPPPEFFDHKARAARRDGVDLVAIVHDGADRVVGEAGYWLQPDGAGDFAITVARDWRGWLGAYLLDALLEVAAANGITTLEADILAENGPMMAVVKHRRYVTVGHGDWSTVRVAIGTGERGPQWPGRRDRPRVLVEVPGGRWRGEAEARAAGLDLIACPGPASTAGPRCPVLRGEPCPLVEGADVVVYSLRGDDGSAVLCAHPRLHPGVALCLDLGSTPGAEPLPGMVALSPLRPAEAVKRISELARQARA